MALIGADGIWSRGAAPSVPGGEAAIFRPDRLARNARSDDNCRANTPRRRVQLWMGPNAHLVAYPISGAQQINVVAVVPGTWNRPGWSAPGEATELKNAFASQHWPATGADDARTPSTTGANGRCSRCPTAANGTRARSRCSATPCTPCCRLPRKAPGWRSRTPPCWQNASARAAAKPRLRSAALKRYGRQRRARVARVQRTARRNGKIYHLTRRAGAGPRLAHPARSDRSACWRGRTGFMTGGCEWGCSSPSAAHRNSGSSRPQADTVPGLRFTPDRGLRILRFLATAGLRTLARGRAPARSTAAPAPAGDRRRGLASVALPGFLGELRLPAHRDVFVAIGDFGHDRPADAGFRLRHQPLQFRGAGGKALALGLQLLAIVEIVFGGIGERRRMFSPMPAQPDRPARAQPAPAPRQRENNRRWDSELVIGPCKRIC